MILINDAIDSESIAKAQLKLFKLAAELPVDEPIYLFLDTPGGSITAGRLFIDTVKGVPHKVHTITLTAASMGYIIAQHLDNRYILESGTMMSHRARIGGLSGQIPGEVDSRLRNIRQEITEINETVANRLGVPRRFYEKWIHDELWLSGKDAVFFGHADEIPVVTCDESLMDTYTKEVSNFFFSASVEFSKCPLIRGPLKITQKGVKKLNNIRELVEKELKLKYKKIELTW
jgi:ATP-dependent Clp protease protease subunit